MAKIAVFDSGLGSLSIIRAIQKICKVQIIYFADQKNFPYGKRSKSQLEKIIKKSIQMLEKNFSPFLIVIGSNTPTIMLNVTNEKIIGVNPPLKEASKISKTKNIAILGTKSAIKSKELSNYIKKSKLPKNIVVHKINGSPLVDLVESGKFLTRKKVCKNIIKKKLENELIKNKIDVVTLSSTHLPFLQPMLESEFSNITFIDPAKIVAKNILNKIKTRQENRNSLRIFTSGNPEKFQNNLLKLKIKNKVNSLSI